MAGTTACAGRVPAGFSCRETPYFSRFARRRGFLHRQAQEADRRGCPAPRA
jgi:hypothetical protein